MEKTSLSYVTVRVPVNEKPSGAYFIIFEGRRVEKSSDIRRVWYWRLVAENGKKLAVGAEPFTRKDNAVRAVLLIESLIGKGYLPVLTRKGKELGRVYLTSADPRQLPLFTEEQIREINGPDAPQYVSRSAAPLSVDANNDGSVRTVYEGPERITVPAVQAAICDECSRPGDLLLTARGWICADCLEEQG